MHVGVVYSVDVVESRSRTLGGGVWKVADFHVGGQL